MQNRSLIRVGAISALVYAGIQLISNILHGPVPNDTVEALTMIGNNGAWVFAHVLFLSSYFVIIPTLVGIAASLPQDLPVIRVAVPLVIAAVPVGVVQIGTHLAIFKPLADLYLATADAGVRANAVFFYDVIWPFNLALEIAHLLVIYGVITAVGVVMLGTDIYPRWVAWLGTAGGVVAAVGIVLGELFVRSSIIEFGVPADVIFGVTLIPLVVWIVAVAIILLRLKPQVRLEPA